MLSVRALVAVFSLFLCVSFHLPSIDLEGRWLCKTKSGQLDANVSYDFNCHGEVIFQANGVVESTCTDVFIPNGCRWTLEASRLVLSDSQGKRFAEYDCQQPDVHAMILMRKEVRYTFERVFTPRPAGR